MSNFLSQINSPQDLKKLSQAELQTLASEIRQRILEVVSETGGHVATNMGIVELTIALHYVFDTPQDKLVWDVSNQCYTHKLLTGRKETFHTLRTYQGLSGFAKIAESEYDCFGAGHASTGLSAALGMVVSRDLKREDHKVVCIVGDGALTGGLSFEALNNAGSLKKDFIVILNDNSMSISKNVGALAKYLTDILTDTTYNKIKRDLWKLSGKLKETIKLRKIISRLEESVKGFLVPGMLFEKLGFRYFGPIDGHNLPQLIKTLSAIKKFKGPLLLHVTTVKGKGYEPAEKDAATFHGVGAFDLTTGKSKSSKSITYSDVFKDTIVKIAQENPQVVAITAAMCSGTGLTKFAEIFPDRFFDVGIAEQHAGTFSAGLATSGIKPYLAIYSTFLQRSYDPIIHDVALQNLNVVLCIDRAGLVGEDGPTHHGVFDISYLRLIPNMTILAPKDGTELKNMLYFANQWKEGPIAIRYPRTAIPEGEIKAPVTEIEKISWEILKEGKHFLVLACGSLVYPALKVAENVEKNYGASGAVVNCRFIKPLDEKTLLVLLNRFNKVLTLEENVLKGGFGSAILEFMAEKDLRGIEVKNLGIPDQFIEQGARNILLQQCGLDQEGIEKTITTMLGLTAKPVSRITFKIKEADKVKGTINN